MSAKPKRRKGRTLYAMYRTNGVFLWCSVMKQQDRPELDAVAVEFREVLKPKKAGKR